mmetsp:Transcript_23772/g.47388  ORF Transcript_23772/g.47388 Transcript_23772/m.47388 type:complete len:119 (-) Transcript_23772:286-642(-)
MLSAARLATTRIARANAPRAVNALGATRSMVIGDTFGAKEKVEEDRYIRAREQEIAVAKAKAAAAEANYKELEGMDKEKMAAKSAAMNEIADLLAQTGDVISEAGLANLARWKIQGSK